MALHPSPLCLGLESLLRSFVDIKFGLALANPFRKRDFNSSSGLSTSVGGFGCFP